MIESAAMGRCADGAILLAAIAIASAASACETGAEPRHRRRDPGALVVAQATGPLKLDPVRVTDNESIEVGSLLFEGLVRWKPGTTDVAPSLATRWEVSNDGRRWRFFLRPGVQFHDGTDLDADAVVFSFQRLLDPKHANVLGDDGRYWRSLLKSVTNVTAIDPNTVEVEVAQPYAPLLGNLAMFAIVSPTAVRRWGDAFRDHPAGTGPFGLETWIKGEHLIVRRFDRYWGKAAVLERIVFRVVVDARQRLVELESGSVDLATSILPDEQAYVELHPELVLHHTAGNDVSYLAFNMQKKTFADIRARRAAAHAINKEPIVKLAYQGRAVAADGPLPPSQWAYHRPKHRYGFDPGGARKLLDDAVKDGAFDRNTTYKLYAMSTPRPYLAQPERVARFIQAALDQVGIRSQLIMQPYPEHRASLERGEHDLALFGWIGDTGDPDNFLYVLFHSDNSVGVAQNLAFYRESTVDKWLIDAQAASDEGARSRLYRQVQDKIAEDAPWVPIAHSEYVVAGRIEIENVVLSPLGHPIYAAIHRRPPSRR
jgi:peptide/nickel transport system substrate-binding protein